MVTALSKNDIQHSVEVQRRAIKQAVATVVSAAMLLVVAVAVAKAYGIVAAVMVVVVALIIFQLCLLS